MKTAISLPESVFEEAEEFAHRVKKSRSQLYVVAIEEYLTRHASDNITEAMNGVSDLLGKQDFSFTTTAAQKLLVKEPW